MGFQVFSSFLQASAVKSNLCLSMAMVVPYGCMYNIQEAEGLVTQTQQWHGQAIDLP